MEIYFDYDDRNFLFSGIFVAVYPEDGGLVSAESGRYDEAP